MNHTRSSVGKIARLPYDIRTQLNQRLLDGQPAKIILAWLNKLPQVKEILNAHFGWRAGIKPSATLGNPKQEFYEKEFFPVCATPMQVLYKHKANTCNDLSG